MTGTGARSGIGGARSELERWQLYVASRRDQNDAPHSYDSPFHFELPPKGENEVDAEEFFKQVKLHRGNDSESKLMFYALHDMNIGQRSFNPALYQNWHDVCCCCCCCSVGGDDGDGDGGNERSSESDCAVVVDWFE
jgi:hypothetical protein